jgi:hypothetical protein
MGFYLELSCGDPVGVLNRDRTKDGTCGFYARIGNATEFYLDAEGAEREYGHPVCRGPEAARRGILGYWRDLLCWHCGRQERDSIRLHRPCRNPAMAWALFPPPDLNLRRCPDCNQILWDVGGLQMLLEYREDPDVSRSAVQERLTTMQQRGGDELENTCLAGDEALHEMIAEMRARSGDPLQRLQAEADTIRDIRTPDQMLLHRLGLAPQVPVREESVAALKLGIETALAECEKLRKEMLARFEEHARMPETPASGRGGDGFMEWYQSPAMKAKRRLDRKMEETRVLVMHWHFAQGLLKDQALCLAMFRRRCPKCKKDGLRVSQYHT